MTENTYQILYGEEIPQDLFSTSHSIPVYDIEKKATTGEEGASPSIPEAERRGIRHLDP